MPGKYSHSVVLATYSSRRISSDVTEPHRNRSRADVPQQAERSTHVSASKAANQPLRSREQPVDRSTVRASTSSPHRPRSTQKGQCIYSHASDVTRNHAAIHGQQTENNKHNPVPPAFQSHTKAKPIKQPQTRENHLTDPYEGYMQRMSRVDIRPAERLQWTNSQAATEHKTNTDRWQVERLAAATERQRREPPLRGTQPSRPVSNVVPSRLFSVQQFLDMSPRIDRPLMSSPSPTHLQQSTPSPRHRKSSTSFIDSSDDEESSPSDWISRGNPYRPATQSAPEGNIDRTRPTTPAKAKPVQKADVTKDLPSIPSAESTLDEERRQSRGSSHNSPERRHARQGSADLEENNIGLPLQRYSPLRQSPSLQFVYSSHVSIEPNTGDDDELESSPGVKSPESPDKLHKSPSMTDGVDTDSNGSGSRETVQARRRYYRSMGHEIPSTSTWLQLAPRNSSSGRSSLEDLSRISPTTSDASVATKSRRPGISSSSSYSERNPRTPTSPVSPIRSESAPPRLSEDQGRNILTDMHRLSNRPVNPMPNFGIPSVARSPKISPPCSPIKPHPPLSPSKLKQARSSRFKQHTPSPPLPCITEAISETAPADPDTYKLPEPSPLSSIGSSKENLSDSSNDLEKGEHEVPVAVELDATETEIRSPKQSDTDTVSILPQTGLDACSPTSPSEVSPIAGRIHPAFLHIDESSGSDSSDQEEDEIACPPDIRRYRYFQMPTVGTMMDLDEEPTTRPSSSSSSTEAATPPSVPFRRPVASSLARYKPETRRANDNDDRMQSLMSSLHSGPQITPSQVVRRKTAVERLEEMIRQTEAEAAERKRKKGVMGLVRLLAR
ncbi:hypothetical protein PV10_08104 [Exophiala mesophila]|uniref:Uncharacterized protein n=1 Tax=Exophiala mesophila TaxID=212818 RepID=A0A0D1ZNR0_EXOME|nr:uncharacterized protein PV10_08104 [Exophiala mesophila]KIV88418.1 hypothetical protein PV10_08104 [Exophiala mesophila]